MAKKELTALSQGIQSNAKRMRASGAEFGAKAKLAGIANRNVEVSTWRKGDAFIVPDVDTMEATLFVQTIGTNSPVAGILVDTESSGTKTLYFNTLRKSVVPYNEKGQATGEPVIESNTPLHDAIVNCGTAEEIYDFLTNNAGKRIEVIDSVPVSGPRYQEGQIVGNRKTTVPFFDFKEKVAAGA